MGGVLTPRPYPALVFLPGRRSAALLHCQPRGERWNLLEIVRARVVASVPAGGAGHLPALHGPYTDLLYNGRHAHADRLRIPLPFPAGLSSATLGVGCIGCCSDRILAGLGALPRRRPQLRLVTRRGNRRVERSTQLHGLRRPLE